MKRLIVYLTVCITVFLSVPSPVSAESGWSLNAVANALSIYEWRGSMSHGLSLQPEVTLTYTTEKEVGLYGDVWFDHSFLNGIGAFPISWAERSSYNELDATLGVNWKGLDFKVAGYITPLYDMAPEEKTTLAIDATLGYFFDFGLGLEWSTLLKNPDYDKFSSQPFDSYMQVSYGISVSALDLSAIVGAVPWTSPYISDAEGFHFTKLALGVGHTFVFDNETLSIPLTLNYIYNPSIRESGLQLTVGFSFDTEF